jgi:small-conductance mechanosensitive channel
LLSTVWNALVRVAGRTALGELALWQWGALIVATIVAWALSKYATKLVAAGLASVAERTDVRWDDKLVAAIPGPSRLASTAALTRALLGPADLSPQWIIAIEKLVVVAFIIAAAWLMQRVISFAAALFDERAADPDEDHEEALRRRALTTQVRMLRRVASIIVGFLALCLALLQFDVVRNVGVSLLASAGVLGMVLGIAAQRSISSLLMGVQLSLTQPVRLGDTVVFEGEWGQIEEITLTYVVLRVWDKRRLVIPVTKFLEQPVQNWTRTTPELVGTVFVRADPTVPVDRLRAALDAMLEGEPLWDGATKSLLVTSIDERSVELRASVSAKDGPALWDLRCNVRERLLEWLQREEGGRYLPKSRVELRST